MENRLRLRVKAGALQRYLLWHYFHHLIPYYFVSEFPKSGASWFCKMLAEATGLDFPQNKAMPLKQSIFKSHYKVHGGLTKPIVIIRDGRDVMVSAYHHFIIGFGNQPGRVQVYWRHLLQAHDYENVDRHLVRFISLFFLHFRIGGKNISWDQHATDSVKNKSALVIRYENLIEDAVGQLIMALDFLGLPSLDLRDLEEIVQRNSFSVLSGRAAGTEKKGQFLRKGISGDWKNYFNKEACETFDNFAGEALISLGYESGHHWY